MTKIKTKELAITFGITINLGDYESAKISMTRSVDLTDSKEKESIIQDQLFRELQDDVFDYAKSTFKQYAHNKE